MMNKSCNEELIKYSKIALSNEGYIPFLGEFSSKLGIHSRGRDNLYDKLEDHLTPAFDGLIKVVSAYNLIKRDFNEGIKVMSGLIGSNCEVSFFVDKNGKLLYDTENPYEFGVQFFLESGEEGDLYELDELKTEKYIETDGATREKLMRIAENPSELFNIVEDIKEVNNEYLADVEKSIEECLMTISSPFSRRNDFDKIMKNGISAIIGRRNEEMSVKASSEKVEELSNTIHRDIMTTLEHVIGDDVYMHCKKKQANIINKYIADVKSRKAEFETPVENRERVDVWDSIKHSAYSLINSFSEKVSREMIVVGGVAGLTLLASTLAPMSQAQRAKEAISFGYESKKATGSGQVGLQCNGKIVYSGNNMGSVRIEDVNSDNMETIGSEKVSSQLLLGISEELAAYASVWAYDNSPIVTVWDVSEANVSDAERSGVFSLDDLSVINQIDLEGKYVAVLGLDKYNLNAAIYILDPTNSDLNSMRTHVFPTTAAHRQLDEYKTITDIDLTDEGNIQFLSVEGNVFELDVLTKSVEKINPSNMVISEIESEGGHTYSIGRYDGKSGIFSQRGSDIIEIYPTVNAKNLRASGSNLVWDSGDVVMARGPSGVVVAASNPSITFENHGVDGTEILVRNTEEYRGIYLIDISRKIGSGIIDPNPDPHPTPDPDENVNVGNGGDSGGNSIGFAGLELLAAGAAAGGAAGLYKKKKKK